MRRAFVCLACAAAQANADRSVARPATARPIRIDAIYVERGATWSIVDDGTPPPPTPRWLPESRATRTLGAGDVRLVLEAIEAGEGGGFLDETGLGPPPAPPRPTVCGTPIVASVRDVAIVFAVDAEGRSQRLRAFRTIESGTPRAWTARSAGRRLDQRGDVAHAAGALDAVERARRAALLGDAAETLRFVELGRIRGAPSDAGSLDVLEAQALERLGRWREAADALDRFADGAGFHADGSPIDPRTPPHVAPEAAADARRLASRMRARHGTDTTVRRTIAPHDPREGDDFDLALAAMPDFVHAGRAADGVAQLMQAARGGSRPGAARTNLRRRALLAAAAFALDSGTSASVRGLLALVDASADDDALAPLLDALTARADAADARRPTAPGPPVGNSPHGG